MAGIGVLRTIEGGLLAFWCAGCDTMHAVAVSGQHEEIWGWNGDYDRPTFTPSVLVRSGHHLFGTKWLPDKVVGRDACWCTYNRDHPNDKVVFECTICHSYVTNGEIQFLGDCTHALRGQLVKLQRHHWEEDVRLMEEEKVEGQSNGGAAKVEAPAEPNAAEQQGGQEAAAPATSGASASPAEKIEDTAAKAADQNLASSAGKVPERVGAAAGAGVAAQGANASNAQTGEVRQPPPNPAPLLGGTAAGDILDKVREELNKFEHAVATDAHEIATEAHKQLADLWGELRGHFQWRE